MRAPVPILLVLGAVGCGSPKSSEPQTAPSAPLSASAPAGGGSGSIAPLGPNVGGMTPVAGGESLGEGTGGGLGSMAKDQARKAAGQAGAAGMSGETGE